MTGDSISSDPTLHLGLTSRIDPLVHLYLVSGGICIKLSRFVRRWYIRGPFWAQMASEHTQIIPSGWKGRHPSRPFSYTKNSNTTCYVKRAIPQWLIQILQLFLYQGHRIYHKLSMIIHQLTGDGKPDVYSILLYNNQYWDDPWRGIGFDRFCWKQSLNQVG